MKKQKKKMAPEKDVRTLIRGYWKWLEDEAKAPRKPKSGRKRSHSELVGA